MIEHVYGNSYPGRGIIIGASEDGTKAVVAYFIMGRSVNSRNRVFVEDGDGIRTQAYDPSKLSDPSLIIYAPVRVFENKLIVTNGDQTDTIYDALVQGKSFTDALRTREFEPDAPNFTSRISGMAVFKDGGFSYQLSILKAGDPAGSFCNRFFFEYEKPLAGKGHFIHTYERDGNPIPAFAGEPETVTIHGPVDDFANELWNSLDAENKVSLFVRYIDVATGAVETRIINKEAL